MATVTRPQGAEIAAIARGMQGLQRLRASRQVHHALTSAIGVELSQQAVQVLVALDDGQSVAELARAAHMDVAAVSRQLRVLEEAGYLERAPSPDNGAVVLVTATRLGRSIARRVTEVRNDHLGRALSEWSAGERHQLAALLQRLVDDLQATPYLVSPTPVDPRSTT